MISRKTPIPRPNGGLWVFPVNYLEKLYSDISAAHSPPLFEWPLMGATLDAWTALHASLHKSVIGEITKRDTELILPNIMPANFCNHIRKIIAIMLMYSSRHKMHRWGTPLLIPRLRELYPNNPSGVWSYYSHNNWFMLNVHASCSLIALKAPAILKAVTVHVSWVAPVTEWSLFAWINTRGLTDRSRWRRSGAVRLLHAQSPTKNWHAHFRDRGWRRLRYLPPR